MVSRFFRVIVSFLLLFIITILAWLISTIETTTDDLKYSIEKHENQSMQQHASNFIKSLESKVKHNKKELHILLEENPSFQKICNNNLEIMRSKEIPYTYVLWLDDDGKFRYLCDGSVQKSHFYQKFDPGDFERWKNIYKVGVVNILDQSRYKGLWKSMLIPIVKDKNSIALLVIDYSTSFPNKIKQMVSPVQTFLIIILITIIILIILIGIEVFLIYITKKKSYRDALTGAYNRNFLTDISSKLSLEKYHILMIDLDYFKQINDLYGHLIGDKALKHVVSIIEKIIKKKDYLIRFGGEEFIVFLHVYKNERDSFDIAENIRLALEKNHLKTDEFGDLSIKASIGVNTKTNEEKDFQSAIKNTDIALYNAKKSGRNCVKKVTSFDKTGKVAKTYTFSYIKSLIDKEAVSCRFQPIFSNITKNIVKYEVLVRLKDENGKLIMPNDFLSIIWKTNIYQKLTKQIIEQSVEIFKNKTEQFSINLGLQDILNEEIILIIEEIAKKESQTVKRMGIEILEYDRFEDVDRLGKIIERLKKLGISVILDDFGSGHANFAIVEQLDFDEIKIDGSIVEHINTNKKSKALLETLASFAIKSNIKTTVEYVSTKEIFDSIVKIPFDQLQGFYLGKPQEL